MGDGIIIGILLIVVWYALRSAAKHFKGQGGCCGGGDTVREKKKLTEPKIGEKHIRIEGMQCDNCKKRVEQAVNALDGVVCKVNLRKKLAVVSFSEPVDEQILKDTIERLGFEVTDIS